MSKQNRKQKQKAKLKGAALAKAQSRTPEDYLKEIDAAVAEGRGRKAVSIYKMATACPGYDEKNFLGAALRAYTTRYEEMVAENQARDADAMLAELFRNRPQWKAIFPLAPMLFRDLRLPATDVLGRYGKDPEMTAAIETVVREKLLDIRPLARHPGLPADHPLKQGAALVLAAWEEVESENDVGPAYAALLERVGRRSVFADWRLFVQGLHAFYRNRDEEALNGLGRISPNSIVARLAAPLAATIRGDTASPVARRLVSEFSGNKLYAELARIDDALERNDIDAAELRLCSALSNNSLWVGKPLLRIEVGTLGLYLLATRNSRTERFFRHPLASFCIPRMTKWANKDLEKYWERYIFCHDRGLEGAAPLSNLEKATLYTRLAEIARDGDFDEDFDEDDASEEDFKYYRKAIALYPLTETYAAWIDAIGDFFRSDPRDKLEGRGAWRKAELTREVLEMWTRDFPEDSRPLFQLAREYREDPKTVARANECLTRLDVLLPGSPEVAAVRNFSLMDRTADEARRGEFAAAKRLAGEIKKRVNPLSDAFVGFVEWLAARSAGDPNAVAKMDAALAALKQPLFVAYFHYKCFAVPGRRGEKPFPNPVGLRLPELNAADDDFVRDFRALINIADPQWRVSLADLQELSMFPIGTAFLRAGVASETLLDILEFLRAKDPDMTQPFTRMAIWPLTANGIRREDRDLPIFLTFRALAFSRGNSYFARMMNARIDRVNSCLRCAYSVALDDDHNDAMFFIRDVATKMMAMSVLMFPRKLSERETRKILKLEGDTVEAPSEKEPPRRKTTRKAPAKKKEKAAPEKKKPAARGAWSPPEKPKPKPEKQSEEEKAKRVQNFLDILGEALLSDDNDKSGPKPAASKSGFFQPGLFDDKPDKP